MRKINQSFTVTYAYPVIFTRSVFADGNDDFLQILENDGQQGLRKLLFIIDDNVARLHPTLIKDIEEFVANHQDKFSLAGKPLCIPGGEVCKNDPRYVHDILKEVNDKKIDRHAYLVAIGGGAILDLAGYASTIAHRGIRHIRIPTTVLSQNDSGIGVKNSVNFFNKKNFLGTFAPPFAVINDSEFLTTLEDRDWRSGISEAIKVALIKDAAFYQWIEENRYLLNKRDMSAMEYLIYRCAELHLDHIAGGDPFERGSSRPLDFGHWAAHKLEQTTNYELRHGEAVAIGMALDVTYAYLKGMLDEASWKRILFLIQELGFALYVPALSRHLDDPQQFDSIIRGLEEFREHLGGKLTIMLIESIGKGIEVYEMEADLIKDSIRKLQEMRRV